MVTTPTPIVRSLAVCFPPFAARVTAALAAARAAGHDAYVFESWRPARRQSELYAQGRTTKGPMVTRAKAWQSWHQYGLAVDLAFGGPHKWTWDGDFAAVGAFFLAEGLRTLAPFEVGHWEWACSFNTDRAQTIATADGVLAVWHAIEAAQAA